MLKAMLKACLGVRILVPVRLMASTRARDLTVATPYFTFERRISQTGQR
ncbi:MAG: hypothetical protein BWY79_01517 [Actinobacteria bacterium ADurb.Bin444]|nr:MAG: hypothetical protein BWY79_01517 [Actinobacteria bacterium ADurb.Bin444]